MALVPDRIGKPTSSGLGNTELSIGSQPWCLPCFSRQVLLHAQLPALTDLLLEVPKLATFKAPLQSGSYTSARTYLAEILGRPQKWSEECWRHHRTGQNGLLSQRNLCLSTLTLRKQSRTFYSFKQLISNIAILDFKYSIQGSTENRTLYLHCTSSKEQYWEQNSFGSSCSLCLMVSPTSLVNKGGENQDHI